MNPIKTRSGFFISGNSQSLFSSGIMRTQPGLDTVVCFLFSNHHYMQVLSVESPIPLSGSNREFVFAIDVTIMQRFTNSYRYEIPQDIQALPGCPDNYNIRSILTPLIKRNIKWEIMKKMPYLGFSNV